ncbi:MAG TPA: bifunctional demethylmenaquinone methyltransferase/2-methoxy-6-polyprenyl-1,4-benzoquinol methylase UbiE [Candidatus Dormibacteraeota bacterium]|nr:bifunctional demethylmenaquinone methyltransferase/2-methoxy-6-polyprenyl-1,4-benzoquinol methylase UbiE [Candidatus Dormibacteraeota bacterium]
MGNVFYEPGKERAAKVGELFARLAPRYDFINDLQSFGLHRRWKKRVVKLAAVKKGDKALDVCCGTGDIAQLLARSGADVVGLDFSEQMLEVARQRGARKGQNGILRFVQGDAQQLPFGDGEFDIMTIGYGLRNLADWEVGLREMKRVAKPGGRLVVLEFGKPGNVIWRRIYFSYLRICVPLLGLFFCGSYKAYAYILESLKHYPGQQGVAEKMRELGFAEVGIVNILGGAMSINFGRKL